MQLRNYSVVVFAALAVGQARAQDVPLSKILVENEGWRGVAHRPVFPAAQKVLTKNGVYAIHEKGQHVEFLVSGVLAGSLSLPGLTAPTCLALWPDQGHLVIGTADGPYMWAVRLEKDGSFGPGDRYYSLRTRAGAKMRVTALTLDAGYLLYACTPLGVQIFDPTGRLSGVVPVPGDDEPTAIAIAGPDGDTLFVASGAKVFARKIQGKGAAAAKQKK